MTEPSHPDADLELASAYLDGETTEAESAAVEQDPRLLALVDELGAVRDRMRPVPAPPGLVDRQVAVAVGASGSAGGAATVLRLERGPQGRPWYQRVPLAAVAAALVVVALIGAVTLTGSGGDDEETAADSGDATTEALVDDASEFDAQAEAADGALAPSTFGERAAFPDLDALASHVESLVTGDDSASPAAGGSAGAGGAATEEERDAGLSSGAEDAPGCDPVAAAGIGDRPLAAVLAASLGGRDVTAVVVEEEDGFRLLVVDEVTCDVVDERRL